MRRLLAGCLLVPFVAVCVPDVGEAPSDVSRTRILAVRFEPAEVRPKDGFAATALVVGPDGEIAEPATAWAECVAPKRPIDSGSVTTLCLDDVWALPIATGAAVSAEAPEYICANLGPESPAGVYRVPDPDRTGGYYMPVRARVDDETAFGMLRLRCELADVPVDVVRELEEAWIPNQNVQKVELRLTRGEGGRVEVEARIKAASAEVYRLYDADADRIVTRRERLTASFFAAGADVAPSRVEVDLGAEEPGGILTARARLAPGGAGGMVWVVVRDDRGGVAWGGAAIE